MKFGDILFGEHEIKTRVRQLAHEILDRHPTDELCLVPVLPSSLWFVTDLMRYLDPEIKVSIQPAQCKTKNGKRVCWMNDTKAVHPTNTVIISCLNSTGNTAEAVWAKLFEQTQTISLCSLLHKRISTFASDFVGFQFPDVEVVGYGLDYNELYRNLPFIARYNEELD